MENVCIYIEITMIDCIGNTNAPVVCDYNIGVGTILQDNL